MPLTDTIARNAKPAAKPVRMFDRDGLYLEVSPRGGKWWRLKYRYAGKEKRVGALMRAIDGYEGSLTVRCALRLAPLVFLRPGELRHAQWTTSRLTVFGKTAGVIGANPARVLRGNDLTQHFGPTCCNREERARRARRLASALLPLLQRSPWTWG
jgi:hypothetical protein